MYQGEDMEEQKGIWLTILDYAQHKDISISTVRRYIKAGRVKHRLVEGRFEIYISQDRLATQEAKKNDELSVLKREIEILRSQVRTLTEANNDLKMLVQIYEGAQKKEMVLEGQLRS